MANLTAFASNTLAFVFALGVIIFVHEAGHLVMAKLFKTRVLAFSLGFGKKIWGFTRGETEYKVSMIPLGGYVRLGGEDPGEASEDPRDFLNKPRWQRILIYLAGPAMNVLLAIILIAVVLMIGIEVISLREIPPVIGQVVEGSPAAQAGIQAGDEVAMVNGDEVENWDEIHFAVLTSPEKPMDLQIRRGTEQLMIRLTPTKLPKYEIGDAGLIPTILPRVAQVVDGSPAEEAGFEPGDEIVAVDGRSLSKWTEFVEHIESHPDEAVEVEVHRKRDRIVLVVTPGNEAGVGKIGVRPGYFQRLGPVDAVVESVRFNWDMTRQTFSVLGKIFTRQLAAKSALAGPIEIAALSGAAARSGFKHLLQLMGLISISIAILNLLPIPVLDGGQITILLIESVFRRDLSLQVKERINQVGVVLIVALMVVVLWFDLVKNIPEGLLPGSKS